MSIAEIEKRLIAVEQQIANLSAGKSSAQLHPVQSLERIHAAFPKDEAFKEAARLGQKWRKAQRTESRKKAKRK